MSSIYLVSLLFLAILPTITAFPIPPAGDFVKRSKITPGSSIGIGFAVAAVAIAIVALAFYLNSHRLQRKIYAEKNESTPATASIPQSPNTTRTRSSTVTSEKTPFPDLIDFRAHISCPMPVHSTALPEFSPVEPGSPPKFELDTKTPLDRHPAIHELDATQTRRPRSASSVRKSPSVGRAAADRKSRYRSLSGSKLAHRRLTSALSTRTLRRSRFHFGDRRASIFDRSSWFCQGALEVEEEERRERERSVDTLPAYPGPAVVRDSGESSESLSRLHAEKCLEGRRSPEGGSESGDESRKRVPTMDWSGMEWLRGVYAERKSKFRSFYPREEKSEGDE